MRLIPRLAALLTLVAFISLSSVDVSAHGPVETSRNAGTTFAQGTRATLTVTSLADTTDPGTLRWAIEQANSVSPGPDTITFQSGLTGTITIGTTLPNITEELTIIGPGADQITLQAAVSSVSGFRAPAGSFDLSISGLTVSGMNTALTTTGKAVTLADMTFSSNGRSITNNSGSLSLTRVTVSGSTSLRAIYTNGSSMTMTDSVVSGSLQNAMQIDGGTVTITGSTFANNIGEAAGAIYANGTTVVTVVNIANSTFSGNATTNANNADAIYAYQNATVNIAFSTFSGHDSTSATNNFGIIHAGTNADITMTGSIIANNPATVPGTLRECSAAGGATFTGSDNLTNQTTFCAGHIGVPTNVSATLADNGGPTQTHALLAGSNAIDAYTGAACPAADQRGEARPAADTDCDLGAFEVQVAPVCPTSPATIPTSDVDALIFAIECANSNGPGTNDVIDLTVSTYTLTAVNNVTNGDNGLPVIVSAASNGTLILNGNGATIDGSDLMRVIYTAAGANVTVNDLTVTHGLATSVGGGIRNLGTMTLNRVSVYDNHSQSQGGGILNQSVLTLNDSTVTLNTAANGYAGISSGLNSVLTLNHSTVSSNVSGTNGGGIGNSGTLTLNDSTVFDNTATSGGGGIVTTNGTTILINSTVSGNTVTSGGGGGIYHLVGPLTLNNSTVAENNASTIGDGIYVNNIAGAALTLNNSILANSEEDCVNSGGTVDVNYSLITTAAFACGAVDGVDGNIVGEDPLLGTLTGSPAYNPLLAGSPAINAGSNALVPVDLDFDQAGNARIQGGTVDMGSFETDTPAPAPEIDVTGNSVSIADGDTTPDLADHTDFGTTTVGTPVTRTFTIHNTGSATLTLIDISIPLGFTPVSPFPNVEIGSGGSTTVSIQCPAVSAGTFNGPLTIESNDADESPYTFDVACQVDALVPEINVTGNGVSIADGDTTPSLADHTDFGTTTVGTPVTRTFIIENSGNGTLTIINISLPLGFTPVPPFPNVGVASDGSTTVSIQCPADSPATFNGPVTIESNDADESLYTFEITCQVDVLVPEINVTGNSVSIADGDTTPDLADHTDFGTTTVGTPVTRTFTIENSGSATLTLINILLPTGFQPAPPFPDVEIATGSSTTVSVLCPAVSAGTFNGPLTIESNDADEASYTFDITCHVDHAVPAGITVTETAGSTGITEIGATDTYTVGLDRQPSADVTVTLSFDGQITANGGASPVVLTFTPVNWGKAQEVTVAAVNDSLVEGAHGSLIAHTASSADVDYNLIDPADVSVNIADNDTAEILFPSSGAGVAENLTPYSQNAVLSITSDPAGGTLAEAVTVQITQTPGTAITPDDYALTTASLTFPAGSANAATQLYEVAIINDALEEPDETFVVGFGTVTGPATATGTHTVTILANDAPACPPSPHNIGAGDVAALIYAIECANASAADDVINLTSSIYTLSAANNTTNGPNGLPVIQNAASSGTLTINGSEATIAGSDVVRIFYIDSGASVIINDLTITDGSATNGGAIYLALTATLTLTDNTISDSTATSGGGIYAVGTLSLNNSTISGNQAVDGGGLYTSNPPLVSITGSTITGNTATDEGGGIYNSAGNLTITGSTISDNNAAEGAGVDTGTGTLSITDSFITGNIATGDGGGIYDHASALTIDNTEISGNMSGADGGGLQIDTPQVTITSSTIHGNDALNGGGIYDAAGTLTITDSTISGNSATLEGGGIYKSTPHVTLTNSTLSGNSAATGGGIYNATSSLTLNLTTLSGNSATLEGGGVYVFNSAGAGVQINSSIIANSTGFDCHRNDGTVSVSHSLIESHSGCDIVNGESNNVVGEDPLLGTLTGSPAYYPLLAGSAAINAGSNAHVPVGLDDDQAGNVRIQGGTVDMGSFETNTPAFTPEIDVTGNGVSIADGDTTPDLADHTDFGTTTVGTPVTRTFTIESSGTGTLTLSGTGSLTDFTVIAPFPESSVPANSSTTLTIQCDALAAGSYTETVTIASNDADENPYTFDITCQVDHAVPAGIAVTQSNGITSVDEDGLTDSYTIELSRQPSADVMVTLNFDGQITANGSVSPVVLTFTSVNWTTAQEVTVTAVNDSLVEGAHVSLIAQTAMSADKGYNGVDVANVSVNIADNDTAVVLFPSSGAGVAENLTPYSQNAVLSITSDPAGGTLAEAVTVQMTQTPGTALTPDDYALTTASLTFPAGSANTATQLFSVAIVDDALEEADETLVVGFGAVTGPATATGTHTVTILANDALAPGGNLLLNAGFETASDGITKAANWTSGVLTKKDKPKCDTATKTFAAEGECAFRFKHSGVLSAVRQIRQKVKNPARGVPGESYTLAAMISAKNLTAGATLTVKVKYNDDSKTKATLAVLPGTYDYTAVDTALPLTASVKWVRVDIRAGTASGMLLADALVLWVTPGPTTSTPRSIDAPPPPPPWPDGFRGNN